MIHHPLKLVADLAQAHADPHDPVQQQLASNAATGASLTERCQVVAAEARRMLDAGELEKALPLVEEHKALVEQLSEIAQQQCELEQARAQPTKMQ